MASRIKFLLINPLDQYRSALALPQLDFRPSRRRLPNFCLVHTWSLFLLSRLTKRSSATSSLSLMRIPICGNRLATILDGQACLHTETKRRSQVIAGGTSSKILLRAIGLTQPR